MGWCCMCPCSEGMIYHLLIHCDVAYVLWTPVFSAFGIHWVLLRRVAGL